MSLCQLEQTLPISIIKQQKSHLLLPKLNKNLTGLLKSDWFDINYWQHINAVTGQAKGRNITWFVRHQKSEWVLRHYYRGGLIGKWLKDLYFFTAMNNTRCYQELVLLEQMYQQGLKVPKPIAAKVIKNGFFYQADLIIEKIPDSQDLVCRLSSEGLSEADWHTIGEMIAKFHEAGIYHSDLNAHNILIDKDNEFWLIDFDKCRQRKVEASWQKSNLDRLKRSFVKETQLHDEFHFDDQCWYWLQQGYQYFYRLKAV